MQYRLHVSTMKVNTDLCGIFDANLGSFIIVAFILSIEITNFDTVNYCENELIR